VDVIPYATTGAIARQPDPMPQPLRQRTLFRREGH